MPRPGWSKAIILRPKAPGPGGPALSGTGHWQGAAGLPPRGSRPDQGMTQTSGVITRPGRNLDASTLQLLGYLKAFWRPRARGPRPPLDRHSRTQAAEALLTVRVTVRLGEFRLMAAGPVRLANSSRAHAPGRQSPASGFGRGLGSESGSESEVLELELWTAPESGPSRCAGGPGGLGRPARMARTRCSQ